MSKLKAKQLTALQALVKDIAEIEDHTDVKSGDFNYVPPKAGVTVGRLVEYIDLGVQKQKPFKGKAKQPVDQVRVTFELTHPQNVREIEIEGKGKVKVADRISLNLPKYMNEKAKFYKLFEKMRYGRDDIKHMAQMLGEPFIIKVIHSEPDANKRIYANIQDSDGSFTISAPYKTDPIAGTQELLNVPEAINDYKLFLWENPTIETWNSLFIDGERDVKDEKGNNTKQSKNWLQEKIIAADNYEGSPLAVLLEGSEELPETLEELEESEEEEELDLSELEAEEEVEEEEEGPVVIRAKKPVQSVGKKPVAKAAVKASAPSTKASTPKTTASTVTKSPSKAATKPAAKAAPKTKAKAPAEDPLAALGLIG